ncbi:MAG TPA: succinate dehydrogenase, hydrophobic membrane anchor protein [Gammaproteobacteria bacterium]|nr:succinate dehydrogenase, hydrophobic membrane anchor protein [Gammaproteobacteria bacterium]|tara:strand:- start:306 stop:689 length:384 start_codon:yes stop_codon:yes gene_type:complete
MSLQSDLARVRGLGSAKNGTRTFWYQRVTAIALVPLSVWFVADILCIVDASHTETVDWIKTPHVTVLLIALIIALFYHVKIGLQEVIEDYLHIEWFKLATRICLNLVIAMCGLVAIVAVLKISFEAL